MACLAQVPKAKIGRPIDLKAVLHISAGKPKAYDSVGWSSTQSMACPKVVVEGIEGLENLKKVFQGGCVFFAAVPRCAHQRASETRTVHQKCVT